MRTLACAIAATLAVTVFGRIPADADEREFTYRYEAKTLPEGFLEFEPWATFRPRKQSGHLNIFKFREEFEFGARNDVTTTLLLSWGYKVIF